MAMATQNVRWKLDLLDGEILTFIGKNPGATKNAIWQAIDDGLRLPLFGLEERLNNLEMSGLATVRHEIIDDHISKMKQEGMAGIPAMYTLTPEGETKRRSMERKATAKSAMRKISPFHRS